ncbi:MAG: hypothetical protein WCP97_07755 [bacterium]
MNRPFLYPSDHGAFKGNSFRNRLLLANQFERKRRGRDLELLAKQTGFEIGRTFPEGAIVLDCGVGIRNERNLSQQINTIRFALMMMPVVSTLIATTYRSKGIPTQRLQIVSSCNSDKATQEVLAYAHAIAPYLSHISIGKLRAPMHELKKVHQPLGTIVDSLCAHGWDLAMITRHRDSALTAKRLSQSNWSTLSYHASVA